MASYALVGPNDQIIRILPDTEIDPTARTRAGYRWLPIITQLQPAYDSTAETVEGPIMTVGADAIVSGWTKRELTAQELGERSDRAVASLAGQACPVIFEVLFSLTNRVRTLEGQPALTRSQFRKELRGLVS